MMVKLSFHWNCSSSTELGWKKGRPKRELGPDTPPRLVPPELRIERGAGVEEGPAEAVVAPRPPALADAAGGRSGAEFRQGGAGADGGIGEAGRLHGLAGSPVAGVLE